MVMEYISAIKAARNDYAAQTVQLERSETEASLAFVADPSSEAYLALTKARRDVKLHCTNLT